MGAKFDFFERVKIVNPLNSQKKQFKGKNAVIFGQSQDDIGKWYYQVKIDDHDEGWYFSESELESLGTFAKREDYYSGESIRVGVTKEGEGYIKEDKQNKK